MQRNSLVCCGGGGGGGGGGGVVVSGWRGGYCHVIKTANIVKGNVESFHTDCTYTKRTINTESTVFCHQLIERFTEYSRIPRFFHQYILVAHTRQECKSVGIFAIWFFVVK